MFVSCHNQLKWSVLFWECTGKCLTCFPLCCSNSLELRFCFSTGCCFSKGPKIRPKSSILHHAWTETVLYNFLHIHIKVNSHSRVKPNMTGHLEQFLNFHFGFCCASFVPGLIKFFAIENKMQDSAWSSDLRKKIFLLSAYSFSNDPYWLTTSDLFVLMVA